MQFNLVALFVAVTISATIPACTRYDVIPDPLETHIEKGLSYQDIARSPNTHKGKLIVLGGKVVSTTRFKDRTRIEVLQLPLTDDYIPRTDQEGESQGRFYAYDAGKEILDPTSLPEGTPITLVGEVASIQTTKMDDADRPVPTLSIKDLTTWEVSEGRRWWAFPYPYHGGGYLYGARPYGFYYW
ncbi:MAG: Slp family lipoprotein [Nitrospira sp.]|nr:Slp family lipoprotein [Nitrospira sp.]